MEDEKIDQASPMEQSVAFLKKVKLWRTKGSASPSVAAGERQSLLSSGALLQSALISSEDSCKARMALMTAEYDALIQKSSKQLSSLSNAVRKVRAEQQTLRAKHDRLKRMVEKRAGREEALKIAVLRLEEERRQAFGTVVQPHWEVPHHFHMIALEHFRGNKQKQLVEIAELFPGHLRIAAMAKQTSLLPHRVFPQFKNSQKAKETSLKDLQDAQEKLLLKIEELEKIQNHYRVMQTALGIRRNSKDGSGKSKANGNGRRIRGSVGGNGYLDIKRRYFNALNLKSKSVGDMDCSMEELKTSLEDLEENVGLVESFANSATFDWEKVVNDATSNLEHTRKEKKKLKDELDRIRVTRASFEAEMAQLRLFRFPSPSVSSTASRVPGS